MKVKTILTSTVLSSIMLSGLILIFLKPIIFIYIMGTLFVAFCIISIWFMFYSFLTKGSKEETITEESKQEFKEEESNVFTADPVFNPHLTGSGIAANPNREMIANPSRGYNKITIIRDETLATQVLGKTEAEPLPKTGTSNNGWW